jgi:hypothetical protein
MLQALYNIISTFLYGSHEVSLAFSTQFNFPARM